MNYASEYTNSNPDHNAPLTEGDSGATDIPAPEPTTKTMTDRSKQISEFINRIRDRFRSCQTCWQLAPKDQNVRVTSYIIPGAKMFFIVETLDAQRRTDSWNVTTFINNVNTVEAEFDALVEYLEN